ncbi:MAG: hypothetical protein AAF355_07075 [Myxococcota bacterium]
MYLVDLLAALSEESLTNLCRRQAVTTDPQKRLRRVEQAARALVRRPVLSSLDLRDPAIAAAVDALLQAPYGLDKSSIGKGADALIEADVLFPHPEVESRWVMPSAYRVQLPATPSEHPRSARVLLSALEGEVRDTLTRSVGPRALALEQLLMVLENTRSLQSHMESLSVREQRLAMAIEARGGELCTEELLELEKEPARYSVTSLPPRSVSWALVRQGVLLPRYRGVWALPEEVGRYAGRARREIAKAHQAHVRDRVRTLNLDPQRAEFAREPGLSAVVFLARLNSIGVSLRPGLGAPRTAIKRLAREFQIDGAHAELIVSIARAARLSSLDCTISEVGARLRAVWRKGGAWDEGREPEDGHRAGTRLNSIPSPSGVLRDSLLEALQEFEAGAFVRDQDVVDWVLGDVRVTSAKRFLKLAKRAAPEAFPRELEEILLRMLRFTMPALGFTDRAESERASRLAANVRDAEVFEPALESRVASFEGPGLIRFSKQARVSDVLCVLQLGECFVSDEAIWLQFRDPGSRKPFQRREHIDTTVERVRQLVGPLDTTAEEYLARCLESTVQAPYRRVSALVQVGEEWREIQEDADFAELFHPERAGAFLVVREGVSESQLRGFFARFGVDLNHF